MSRSRSPALDVRVVVAMHRPSGLLVVTDNYIRGRQSCQILFFPWYIFPTMIRILFLCVENSCRSQMAEGFARALGRDHVDAASAGSCPSGQVDTRTIAFMREVGVNISRQRSKGLDSIPARVWDYIVTMGCGDACPTVPAHHRIDWDLPDPGLLDDEGFRHVRDAIAGRVAALLASAGSL